MGVRRSKKRIEADFETKSFGGRDGAPIGDHVEEYLYGLGDPEYAEDDASFCRVRAAII